MRTWSTRALLQAAAGVTVHFTVNFPPVATNMSVVAEAKSEDAEKFARDLEVRLCACASPLPPAGPDTPSPSGRAAFGRWLRF